MARSFKRLRHRLRLSCGRYRHHERILSSVLKQQRIDLVVDIGAHVGSYCELLHNLGYRGDAILIEPLSWAHERLTALACKHPRWAVQPRCVAGAQPGIAMLNVSQNGVGSSVLRAEPGQDSGDFEQIKQEEVPQRTLDEILGGVDLRQRRVLVKLDVQGFESAVLDGGRTVLPHVRALQLELSVQALYLGQAHWLDLLNRLNRDGWVLWQIPELSTDRISGALQQFDVIMVRADTA